MGLCPNDLTRFLRSLAYHPIVVSAAAFLLVLSACATTDEQRFPLDYVSGQRAAADPATAREALQAYQRLGANLEHQGRFTQAAIAYSNAYSSARALGRLQDALVVGQKAVDMAERSRSPRHLAPALIQLGHTHMALNAPAKAIPLFENAARHAKEAGAANSEANSYTWLARAYRRIGNRDLAMQSTEKAASVLESAITQMWAGKQRLGPQGQDTLRRMERNYANTLLAIAGNHLALRQMEPARVAFQKALDAAKRTGAPHLIAQVQQGLGAVAMFQGDWEPAARLLEEALRLSQRPNFVQKVQRRLGWVYRQMGKLPEAEVLLRQAVASIEDVRSQLQSEEHREAFVEDKMGAYGNLIGVLFHQRKFAEAFDMSERARARAFLDLLGNRVSLSKGRSAALIAEEKGLQERIVQLKARQELQEGDDEAPLTREKQSAATPAALAVGNPDLQDPRLNLRYAEREAKEVGRQFPGAAVLLRREATKPLTRAQMGPQSLIHLATHADLDEEDPLGSALPLTPNSGDDGRLEVQEVFGLDLEANLVILSACDTSLGRLTQGDEVIGLTRAFIYAGTPSVISTLWRVNDRASYELMLEFYRNLKAGQPKGEALRQAQLTTLQVYPHPYFWAAYQLTGEPR